MKIHPRYGRYYWTRIEDVKPGDYLDMGRFAALEEPGKGQGPGTWNVRYDDGLSSTQTRGARVRVWLDEEGQEARRG